tara:strand:- start:9773 stop:10543 length:771 start_codon:yes stop_codon:yes gene_type:complete
MEQINQEFEDFDFDLFDTEIKTVSEVEASYLATVSEYLVKWESWLAKNLDLLAQFEMWEPVADETIVAASYALKKAIRDKSEAALNNAHDLWCVKAWIEGKSNPLIDEFDLVHGIRSDVVAHTMPRLTRICESDNHPYLDNYSEVSFNNEDWNNAFNKSSWGRSMTKDKVSNNKKESPGFDTGDIAWLPSDAIYAEEVRCIMEARLESISNYQRRRLVEMLEDIVLSSPFYQFTLMHSQVKGVLGDRRSVHVKDMV